jgi:demethylsterigmatocystin 6-O-methyltransferase
MRNILHDHADLKCLIILKNILAAMDTDSLILIDDMVIPNSGVHSYATQIDLTMMASIASRERTKEQWLNLLETAGLKVNQIYTYRPSTGDSIIEATKV